MTLVRRVAAGGLDVTAITQADLGIERPYLLSDIKVLNRERITSAMENVRDQLCSACGKLWEGEALGGDAVTIPLVVAASLRRRTRAPAWTGVA